MRNAGVGVETSGSVNGAAEKVRPPSRALAYVEQLGRSPAGSAEVYTTMKHVFCDTLRNALSVKHTNKVCRAVTAMVLVARNAEAIDAMEAQSQGDFSAEEEERLARIEMLKAQLEAEVEALNASSKKPPRKG